MTEKKPAIFFDRDGVLIRDIHLLTTKEQVELVVDAKSVVSFLKKSGFLLLVASNQAVVARGLISMKGVEDINCHVNELLSSQGERQIEKFYFCPHHPQANVELYRKVCPCRKPEPGLLFKAAQEYNINLEKSFMIGDRPSDILAGKKAGCHTILIHSDKTDAHPIVSPYSDSVIEADHECSSLSEAARFISQQPGGGT